ncbi:hypothetical protein [Sanguibacter sp. Leaf3]|uniref:hypothetical protein n=1 Tax=Sanguibacter sp. Leaf3 TaxID=1736209 RepID=UPI0006FDCC0B|nr:hypothetical protein [Sanguibacter sp. Leaf3]KQT99577.1 hypothetical protein ASG53_01590 [Sanguibacter sp. Leaf3]
MSTDPQGSTHRSTDSSTHTAAQRPTPEPAQGPAERSAQGPRHGTPVDDASPRTGRGGRWGAGAPRTSVVARPVGLVVAAVAGLAVVSTGIAIGAGSPPPTAGSPAGVVTAAPTSALPGVASTTAPVDAPDGDAPVGDPEDAPTVDLPPSAEPPVIEWDDLPEPAQPDPAPEPVATLPPLPTLPPLAPVPDVVAPGTPPSGPSEPAGPRVPTLTGPAAGTVLITFPTVSGAAEPGATVVVTTTSGDSLATAVADTSGAWSAQVCGELTGAPAACLTSTDALTVAAHARDETTGSESEASTALSWTFDRPVLAAPTDGEVIEAPDGGDVPLRVEGTAGELVQLSVDGTPTGELHRVAGGEDLVWRGPSAGSHTLSLRYVDVGEGGTAVTGFGPSRTWTVSVAEVGGAPEGTLETAPGEVPGGAPAEAQPERPGSTPASTPSTTP